MTDILNDLNDLFGKELSQAALDRGITKREQNETY